jgi:hypothetical protein
MSGFVPVSKFLKAGAAEFSIAMIFKIHPVGVLKP